MNENSSASYTATAYFSDGTSQDVTGSAAWSENSAYAYFDSYAGICSSCGNGKLITQSVTSNQSVTVTASYTYGGVTKSGTKTVVVTDTASVVASAPVAPTNLKATAVSSSSIKVTWTDSSANETGFTVWRWNNSQWVKIGTVSANMTSYTDTGLKAGTTYFYQVGAYNSAGTTYASSYASGATSSGGYAKPYILKQGCTFTLYTDYGTSTATSSSSGGWSSSSITSGGIQVVIQNCVITSNPQNVPVYEQ